MTNGINGSGASVKRDPYAIFERLTTWIGSISSLVFHTIVFVLSFGSAAFGYVEWDTMLLVLTTLVSLEAIYIGIFIQMTVNRHQKELEEVSEDVEDIQEDIQEISEDVEGLGDDVEDIQEDIQELTEEEESEEARKTKQMVSLEQLTSDIQRVLKDLETLKKQ
jgi:uncharacterized protein YlxW (UPF0749 family)